MADNTYRTPELIHKMLFERYPYAIFTFIMMIFFSVILSSYNRNDTDVPWKKNYKLQTKAVFPGHLEMRNSKWKLYGDKKSQEGAAALFYKKNIDNVIKLEESTLHEIIISQMHSSRRGVYLISGQGHGKVSYITNFLCTESTAEIFPICNNIMFYHACSLEDETANNPFRFIKEIAKNILSLFPQVGTKMYFDTDIEDYLYGRKCSQYPSECIDSLIAKPLQDHVKMFSTKRYLICVDHLDECSAKKRTKWDIIGILHILIEKLPSKIYFLLTSSSKKHIFKELGIATLDGIFNTYGDNIINIGPCVEGISCDESGDIIGYSRDSTEILIQLFLILAIRCWNPRRKRLYIPITIACCLFIHTAVNVTPFLVSVQLLCAWWSYIFIFAKKLTERRKITKKPTERQKIEYAQKDWFYKLTVHCDNIDINCIIDKRLETKYKSFGSVLGRQDRKENDTDLQSTKNLGQLSRDSMCEFELMYMIKNDNIGRNDRNLNQSLVAASNNKRPLLCRWLLANIENEDDHDIDNALQRAFHNLDNQTAKVLAWAITKRFYRIYEELLRNTTDLYPGIQCICRRKGNNTKTLCSQQKLIIVSASNRIRGLPRVFRDFRVKKIDQSRPNPAASECKQIIKRLSQLQKESFFLKMSLSSEFAEDMFLNHRNLSLICPSVVKSTAFKRHKHAVKREVCIQLYCKTKGILPLGESHFPEIIQGYQTDVIEADTRMLSNLRIGNKIIWPTESTLGGFVKYGGVDCFLTCAHAMYDVKTLLDHTFCFTSLPETAVGIQSPDGLKECGRVKWLAFDTGDGSRTSIDAALIELHSCFYIDRDDYVLDKDRERCPFSSLGLSSKFLNNSCLDHEELDDMHKSATVVAPGAITLCDHIGIANDIPMETDENVPMVTDENVPMETDENVQFSPMGPTAASVNGNVVSPLWIAHPAHIHVSNGNGNGQTKVRMYNQMVLNLPLQPGDSGTCIYIVNHPTKTGCIGMAIAMCGGQLTVVTPLKDILKRVSSK